MDIGSASSGLAVNQGLIGMQRSQAEISRSAQQIVKAGTTESENPQNDIVESLVNIKVQTQVFDASAKIVKAADDTIGTLLDLKA